MKKILFLSILLICCACKEDKSIDPTIMPAISATGANTMGCLVDGWVYASGRYGKPNVQKYTEDGNQYVRIQSEVGMYITLSLTLVNPVNGEDCDYINATFDSSRMENGKAHITRYDSKVISGTFAGGEITKGRFDLKYIDNENNN